MPTRPVFVVCLGIVLVGAVSIPVGAATPGPELRSGSLSPATVTDATASNASSPAITTPGSPSLPAQTDPTIVALYPNPVAADDRGESVVVRVPAGANATNLTLTDGEDTVRVPPARRTVVVSNDPLRARNRTDYRPVRADAGLALSNTGERVVLRRDGVAVDAVDYDRAPAGERLVRTTNGSWEWRPLGFDPRPVATAGPANATVFVLPDSPRLVVETLTAAEDRILLAGYTLTSRRIVDTLIAAHRRGVDVQVLVEGEPVGGIPARQAAALDRLVEHGVPIAVLGGPRARFRYHHAKYAVVDDAALVLTENWKPSGVGGRHSRGWGVRTDSPAVAADLATLFRSDAAGLDTTSWGRFREGRRFVDADAANGTYPSRIESRQVAVDRVRVLTAPGNAEREVVSLIDSAERRVDVVQPTVGRRDGVFLRAVVQAAERGVRVRILLSDAWYVARENRRLVAWLNDLAERRGLPLDARVADPGSRFGKIHAKGLVVDDTAVVGSMNWNPTSARENREVLVALAGEEPAGYFRQVFEADWRGGGTRLPVGVALGALVTAGIAVAVGRRTIEFERVGTSEPTIQDEERTHSRRE